MIPMILIQVLMILLIVGVLLWGLGQFPMDPTISKLIRVVIIVLVAIWLIYLLTGMLGGGAPMFPRR